MARDDLVGLDEGAPEHAGDHRLGHDARADGRDRAVREGSHPAEYGTAGSSRRRTRCGARSASGGRAAEDEKPAGRRDRCRREAGVAERGLELGGLAVDLDDRELPAVVQPPDGRVVGGRRVVGRAGLGIRQRVDERERAAGLQPATGEGEEFGRAGRARRGSARSRRTARRPADPARPTRRGRGCGRAGRGRGAARARDRAGPARRRRSTARPSTRGAATTSRCPPRAPRSRPGSAGRRARCRRRRARRSRRRRGSARARIGRGGGTSRRTRRRAPRSSRPASRRRRCRLRAGGAPASRRPPQPRASIASRSRNRRKEFSPALPRQSGQSWAQPSRSSGERVVHDRPHQRQSNVARGRVVDAVTGPLSSAASSRPAATSRRSRRGRRSRPASRSRR